MIEYHTSTFSIIKHQYSDFIVFFINFSASKSINMTLRIVLILLFVTCSSVNVFGSLSDLTFTEDYNTNDLPPTEEGEKIQVRNIRKC